VEKKVELDGWMTMNDKFVTLVRRSLFAAAARVLEIRVD
jgi:hypothetical protein